MPGETIHTGAPATCPVCDVTPLFKVMESGAGFYIGTECACGPYSRESHYYGDIRTATEALNDFLDGEEWMLR